MKNCFSFFIFQWFNPGIFGENITHKKYLKPQLLEGNDPISATAKSTGQILSLKVAYTFLHLHFLITDLYYFLATYSFTLAPDPVLLSKSYRPYLLIVFDIHHI